MIQEIKNPYKSNYLLAGLAILGGVLLFFAPQFIPGIELYAFYCRFFGVALVITGIGIGIYYMNRVKALQAFLAKDEEKVIWEYHDAQYENFVGELRNIQKSASKKKFFILMAIILVLSIALYFFLSADVKLFALIFFIFFSVMTIFFVLIMPNIFQFKAAAKPYCAIISTTEAYMMGRYHSWKKVNAKVKEHDNGHEIFQVLAINYEGMTSNGKMFREWSTPLPDDSKETLAAAKSLAKKINKVGKENSKPENNKDMMERAFDKIMQHDDDDAK